MKVATGLYVNWDSVVKVGRKVVRWLNSVRKQKPSAEVLQSEAEAAYLLSQALHRGGREVLISERLFARLDELFAWREKRLGGNGYHMGAALVRLGMRPIVSYPCRPTPIMVASPNFGVACGKAIKSPGEAARPGDPEYEHIIFEFVENPQLGIKATGRQIFSWDVMSSEGIFDYDFLSYVSKPGKVEVLVLGFAHLLKPAHREKVDVVVEALKRAGRPRIHLEVGEGARESMGYAIERFAENGLLDSLGLNEKECRLYLGARSERLADLEASALRLAREFNLGRVCVHTPQAVFSVSTRGKERELRALAKGASLASALTYGSRTAFYTRKLESMLRTPGSLEVKKAESHHVYLLKLYQNFEPKILTGLGDAFAAVQAVFALG